MTTQEIMFKLRFERRVRELSQECVALSINCKRTSLSNIERLSREPPLSTVIAYAEFLGMELILRRKEEK